MKSKPRTGYSSKGLLKFLLRLPPYLHDRVQTFAESMHVSVTHAICVLLMKGLSTPMSEDVFYAYDKELRKTLPTIADIADIATKVERIREALNKEEREANDN